MISGDLFSLSSHLLCSLWPPERLLLGLRVCKRLYEELPSTMLRVQLTLKDCYEEEDCGACYSLLGRIQGKVALQLPTGKPMQYCRAAMPGKLEDLAVYAGLWDPFFRDVDAETVKLWMPGLRALSIDGSYSESYEDLVCTWHNFQNVLTGLHAGCSNLQTLRIVGLYFPCTAWDAILPQVARVATLRSLHVEFANVTKESGGLCHLLTGLSRLERLHLTRGSIMQDSFRLSPTAALPPLTSFTFSYMHVACGGVNALCELLVRLPTLTELGINSLDVSWMDLNRIGLSIARLPALTELNINEFGNVYAFRNLVPWLGHCKEIRVLKMQEIGLTLPEVLMVVATVSTCTHLRELDISESMSARVIHDKAHAEALAAEVVVKLPALRRLRVVGRVAKTLTSVGGGVGGESAADVFCSVLEAANVDVVLC